MKKELKKKKQEFLSLDPLSFEDALKGLIKVKPTDKKKKEKK
jgi:hypothetical protein